MPGASEGGTGRRPHARPEASPPPAKPAALTQYRNSSPIVIWHHSDLATRQGSSGGRLVCRSGCRTPFNPQHSALPKRGSIRSSAQGRRRCTRGVKTGSPEIAADHGPSTAVTVGPAATDSYRVEMLGQETGYSLVHWSPVFLRTSRSVMAWLSSVDFWIALATPGATSRYSYRAIGFPGAPKMT